MTLFDHMVCCPYCGNSYEHEDCIYSADDNGNFSYFCPDCGAHWQEESYEPEGYQIEMFEDELE